SSRAAVPASMTPSANSLTLAALTGASGVAASGLAPPPRKGSRRSRQGADGGAPIPPGAGVGAEGGPNPAGQLAGGGGVQVAGQDRPIDHGVLGPDDAGGGPLPQAVGQGPRLLPGR